MKMKRKVLYIVLFMTLLIAFFCYRYDKVNKDVPSTFAIEYSSIGDIVELDDLQLKVTSTKVEEVSKEQYSSKIPRINFIVEADITNISNDTVMAASMIESSIGIGYNKTQTRDGEIDFDTLKNLQPNKTTHVKLIYPIDKDVYEKGKGSIYLYLPPELYDKQVLEQFKIGKRYGKAVKL